MEVCECERRFETIDSINQHIKTTKRKGVHCRKTAEEIEARRDAIWAEAARKFEDLALELDIKQFHKASR